MEFGIVPSLFKEAYITPLLKKPDLDPADVKSYRPISNLSVLSRLLERLVAHQLLDYLTAAKLQSAYRANHSPETAVLKVLADILRAVDSGDLAVLTLLDLSAAFDTVDHAILLRRLQQSYGLQGNMLSWFTSYLWGSLSARSQRSVGLVTDHGPMWCPAGVGPGTDPVLAVHCGPHLTGGRTRSAAPPLCRRHTDLRFMSTRSHRRAAEPHVLVCRRRRCVDAVQPAATEYGED